MRKAMSPERKVKPCLTQSNDLGPEGLMPEVPEVTAPERWGERRATSASTDGAESTATSTDMVPIHVCAEMGASRIRCAALVGAAGET